MSLATLRNSFFRLTLTSVHGVLKAYWFIKRPTTSGAHAVALTPHRQIILVKLRYAPGWRLPGGGIDKFETPETAIIRELREEIGLTEFAEVRRICDLEELTDFKRDLASLFIVTDVDYRPAKWSWEIEDVMEASLTRLPTDLSPRTARWLQAILPRI